MIGLKVTELISCIWFTDRTSLTQLHGQGRLSTVAWIIKDLESDFRQSGKLLLRVHGSRLSRGCFDKYLSCLQHSKCFFRLDLEKGATLSDTSHRYIMIHHIEDLSQHFGLSYDKYLAVQLQELPTEDLCKTSPTGFISWGSLAKMKRRLRRQSFWTVSNHWLFLNKCIGLVSEWQIPFKVIWAVAILCNCSTSFRLCTVSFPSSSTGAWSGGADRSTKGGRGQKQSRFLFEISLRNQIS